MAIGAGEAAGAVHQPAHDSRAQAARRTFCWKLARKNCPPPTCKSALAQLRERVPALLDELRLAHGEVQVLGTPRRLVVTVAGLADRQPDRSDGGQGAARRAALLMRGPANQGRGRLCARAKA